MSIRITNTYLGYPLKSLYGFLLAGCFGITANCSAFAQSPSNQRSKKIILHNDTTRIDTLSLIPGTITLKNSKGAIIDLSLYKVDYINASVIVLPKWNKEMDDSVAISYSVFPYNFSKDYQHKDLRRIQNNQYGEPYIYTVDKDKKVDFFKTEGLTKSGSISRGISFGNNQNVVLNSNLNLQLAGKLSDNMDILLAATDQNIPIQPQGNTQQLQEFDKVFIEVGIKNLPVHGKTTVTAGDFQLKKPKGYFMNFDKKLQGLSFKSQFGDKPSGYFTTMASAAVSKGKFAKNFSMESSNGNTFNGQVQERNQGPYKLRGAENEQYIIVLSGSEKFYLDGRLLVRGEENDYVIDYNTAEITFTPKNLITKDKRITAEFQYSDKNYARSLVHAGTEYETKGIKARVNIYSEQDNKNRPLQQKLDNAQKILLSAIGDSLQNAITSATDSIAFNNSEVLYAKKDSVHGTFSYPNIYVYSTDSAKAHYRLSFSFVGTNKGNYIEKQSAANGKVYQWVLPDTITGRPNGAYEPVVLLVTPKQKQMVSAGADFMLSKYSMLNVEGAASNYNVNKFSDRNKTDDKGFAGKINWNAKFPLQQSITLPIDTSDSATSTFIPMHNTGWLVLTNLNYEYVQKTFSPIERFRSVEFNRDWNRTGITQKEDQHIIGGEIGLAKNENIILYDYKSFLEGRAYQASRQNAKMNFGMKGFVLTAEGSYLNSKDILNKTDFLRNNASISKEFRIRPKSKFRIGIRGQQEQNLIRKKYADTLAAGSVQFNELEPYIEITDSSKNKYTIHYKQRTDYALHTLNKAALHKSTYAEDYGGEIELMHNPNSQLRITGSYRRLKILDTTLTIQKPENTVIGRTEYNLSLFKGFVSSTTFYEVGSGLELKKEFIYLEVAPGQGIYVWKDYNNDNVKELNEFEVSSFPNEANYIKVWIPTDNYISTYTNQFSEVFTIKPEVKWNNKKGMRRFIARFMNQASYRTDRKTTNRDLSVAYNPFLSDAKDPTLVTLNSILRNSIYFNPSNPVFGMDFTFQKADNKTLLVNDTTYRTQTTYETNARWNLSRQWSLLSSYTNGIKRNNSKFFPTRNFNIIYFEAKPEINFQPGTSFRINLSYTYSEKENKLITGINTHAKATVQNLGNEIKYNALNKGSLSMKINFINIFYNDAENSPLAYEMLDGLKTGKNYTWEVGYSRTIASNIQLTLTYNGRQSPGIKTIHTGNAQVRAYF